MAKTLVLLTATIFLLYGLVFVFFPEQALSFVVHGAVNSSSAVIDIRATYGGMSIGAALMLYLLANKDETLKHGLLGVCFLMAGMAFGRVVGIVLDGDPNIYMLLYLALELIVTGLALLLLRNLDQEKV